MVKSKPVILLDTEIAEPTQPENGNWVGKFDHMPITRKVKHINIRLEKQLISKPMLANGNKIEEVGESYVQKIPVVIDALKNGE